MEPEQKILAHLRQMQPPLVKEISRLGPCLSLHSGRLFLKLLSMHRSELARSENILEPLESTEMKEVDKNFWTPQYIQEQADHTTDVTIYDWESSQLFMKRHFGDNMKDTVLNIQKITYELFPKEHRLIFNDGFRNAPQQGSYKPCNNRNECCQHD